MHDNLSRGPDPQEQDVRRGSGIERHPGRPRRSRNCLTDAVARAREGWTLVVDLDAEATDFAAARSLAEKWLSARRLKWDDFDPRTDWAFNRWQVRDRPYPCVYEVWIRDHALREIESRDSN